MNSRWGAFCGSSIVMAAALCVALGCEKIPEEVLNSPPAKYRADEPPPPDDSPPEQPQDRVAQDGDQRPLRMAAYRPPSDAPLEQAAATALSRLGRPSVPVLVEQLHSDEPARRKWAAEMLARIGPDAVDAVEPLVERLEDPAEQADVKAACARAIGHIGPALWPAPPQPPREAPSLQPLPQPGDESPADTDAAKTDAAKTDAAKTDAAGTEAAGTEAAGTEAGATEAGDPELAEIRRRRRTRRVEYDENARQRQQRYYQQQQEYERRRALAQRAVDALARLALENAGG